MTGIRGAIVRAAEAGDAAQLAAVHVRSWQAAYRGLLPQEYLDQLNPADRAERWRRTLHGSSLPQAGVLVAADDDQLLGFAGFGPSRDQNEEARVGELQSIYLLPQAWGAGLGQRLMAAVLEQLAAAGYAQATLWVLESNVRARRFYAMGGWAADGAVMQDVSRGFPVTEVRYRRQLP